MSRRLAAALVLACLAAPACSDGTYGFVADRRVRVLAPREGQEVQVPFELTWSASKVEPGTSYAVFIDRPPVPPGSDLVSALEPSCRHDPSCVNPDSFAKLGIYPSSGTAVTLTELPDSSRGQNGRSERHRAIVVLIGPDGRRSGESAFATTFRFDRSAL